ncbi:MAG: 2-amino-4-hydroxy-6-hydroxymethyldihydropteridine diphosphokinase [Frankiales bacterium]|nr:2-amino-4-hydroxy-6-hydroxymethyldihydropteridine diphosphokinase [Frankiales bacterium]
MLSLGSNLGDRRAHLRAGLDVIGAQLPVVAVSPLYETEPVGVTDQAAFLNCVAVVGTDDPEVAWSAARAAEETRGRLRSRRWGPRSLDVDVVAVDAVVSDDPRLTLPHPRAHERAFVLRPWLDVDRDAFLAGRGPVWRLLRGLPGDGVTVVAW